ncbi:hypothetical protein [Lysobacter gummosus]|uniref:hypothetical protein n=1 Tax=Lysobacter gummosus TaxID=262324 RepID=UPI00362D23BB
MSVSEGAIADDHHVLEFVHAIDTAQFGGVHQFGGLVVLRVLRQSRLDCGEQCVVTMIGRKGLRWPMRLGSNSLRVIAPGLLSLRFAARTARAGWRIDGMRRIVHLRPRFRRRLRRPLRRTSQRLRRRNPRFMRLHTQ